MILTIGGMPTGTMAVLQVGTESSYSVGLRPPRINPRRAFLTALGGGGL